MSGMEEVLAAHGGHEFGREEADESRWFDKCECGHLLFGIDYSPEHAVQAGRSYADATFAAHVAQELAKAGYGLLHDAWDEGYETGYAVGYGIAEFDPINPYPAGATS